MRWPEGARDADGLRRGRRARRPGSRAVRRQIGIDPCLEGRQAALLEGAAPARANGSYARSASAGPRQSASASCELAGGDEALEPLGVELALVDADEISGRAGQDPVGAEGAPERVDVHLERVLGACRR